MEILLLCDYPRNGPATVRNHIDAIVGMSRHRVHSLAVLRQLPPHLDLERFDAVVLHYSVFATGPTSLDAEALRRISAFGGIKLVFLQDEHRNIDERVAAMRELGADVLFTCVPAAEVEKLYPTAALPRLRRITTLTGYVSPNLVARCVPPPERRPIDVGYRARRLPPWVGELGQEKRRIAERFARDARGFGLVCDISYREEDRLHGEAWFSFVMRCRAMLGTESGASVVDRDGAVAARVQAYLDLHPEAPFEKIRNATFAAEEGKIRLNQISPRCFEAAALRTLLILYPGQYSGILEPHRHYLPLQKDHSNMAEVVRWLRDRERVAAVVNAAYREVACNPAYGFASFVAEFDAAVGEAAKARGARAHARPYTTREFARAVRPAPAELAYRLRRDLLEATYRFVFGRILAALPDPLRDKLLRVVKRTLHWMISDAEERGASSARESSDRRFQG
jgi:hypothetical protein